MDMDQEQLKHLQNARKPSEDGGAEVLQVMNEGNHRILAEWGLSQVTIPAGAQMLDIGCGGGANLKRLLAKRPDGHVTGVDYSDVSVNMSRETNKEAIEEGKCAVVSGDVNSLPFADGSFDFASAFETVYFWPEITHAFSEVFRVLRHGGLFFVCNESDGKDESARKHAAAFDGMTLYTPGQIGELMKGAGFKEIRIFHHEERAHIVVTGKKE